MTVMKEKLSDIKEQYEKAEKLIEEESKSDPVTDPYRSHYKAREVLQGVENNIKNLGDDDDIVLKAILCYVCKEIGRIYMFTEELGNAEKYFLKCSAIVQDHEQDPRCVNVYVDTLNQSSILWSNRDNAETSKGFLDRAEAAYRDFRDGAGQALALSDLFGSPEEVETGKGDLALEKLHTLTLYYMAQIFGNLGDLVKSAHYCHLTLKRQLEYNDYDAIDWALNAATLSQYYFTKNALRQSRHLLAAASYMLDQLEQELTASEGGSDEAKRQKLEALNHRSADISRCWAKYGLYILSTSKERLMLERDDEVIEASTEFEEFKTLNLSLYEQQVLDEFVLTYDDAKLVFVNAQSWLSKAKEYYTSDAEASEYAKIVQDHASLYKYLAFFDEDDGNQCKFHKKRADMLEELTQLLNPTYYMMICREIWYELGLTYGTMLDIKLTALECGQPSPHALNKINKLCDKGIKSFQKFLESYKADVDAEIPKSLTVEELHPILFAYFHVGRLYYKIITPDKVMQLMHIRNSFKYYGKLVKGCEEFPAAGEMMKAEMGVCREMVGLLPLKMQKLSQEIQNQ